MNKTNPEKCPFISQHSDFILRNLPRNVQVIFCIKFITENTDLEKWFVNLLRRAGLCADHFSENSFKGECKKVLKHNSVLLPFKNTSQKQSHGQP